MRALIVVGLLVWLIRWAWVLLVVAAVVAVLWWLVRQVGHGLMVWGVRRGARAAERAAIAARADQQHAWTLAGDDRGIYGEYRPHPFWGQP